MSEIYLRRGLITRQICFNESSYDAAAFWSFKAAIMMMNCGNLISCYSISLGEIFKRTLRTEELLSVLHSKAFANALVPHGCATAVSYA